MMQTLIPDIARVIRLHLSDLVFGITSVSLVLAGPHINKLFRKITKKIHWLLRFILFVILCCAGYGFITHFIYKSLIVFFKQFDNLLLVIFTVFSYLLLAWFAKRKKEI